MADLADSNMIVELSKQRQISVTGSRDGVYLKTSAYRGSLGVTLTLEEADILRKALLAAIVSATVENIDMR